MWVNTIGVNTMLVIVVNSKNETVFGNLIHILGGKNEECFCMKVIGFAQVSYKIMNIPSITISSK